MIRNELELLVENMYDERVYIVYSSYNLCNDDFKVVKQANITSLAKEFYNPQTLRKIRESEEITRDNILNDPAHVKCLLPYKFTIPFPPTPNDFSKRLKENKPIIFTILMENIDHLISKSQQSSVSNADEEFDILIVIHKDLNAARVMTHKFLECGAGDWGYNPSNGKWN